MQTEKPIKNEARDMARQVACIMGAYDEPEHRLALADLVSVQKIDPELHAETLRRLHFVFELRQSRDEPSARRIVCRFWHQARSPRGPSRAYLRLFHTSA